MKLGSYTRKVNISRPSSEITDTDMERLIAERKNILDRIGKADVTFDFRRPDETGPTPGSIRQELFEFDDTHPEVASEMKRRKRRR